ncbi:MAG: adenosylcobinamide-GDP ribazoletransferase [Chlorobiaceae bacterium]|jgi:adenosylcobinamide-GDP ribazoletransferase|nr:adenosylcobinamide-GDP ribazoletransferase [Chlorobiaceae bacterium]
MLRGLVTALRTLTVFPVPGRDTDTFSNALFWFPVAGLLLGLLQAFLAYGIALSGWNELAAVLTVTGGLVFTRGIHADGLADVADGFLGGRTREGALRIMKDSFLGTFGVLALAVSILLKWVAVLKLVQGGSFAVIAAGVLLARWVQVLLASSLPYARSEGGTACAFVQGAGKAHLLTSSFLTMLFLSIIFHGNPLVLALVVPAALAAALLAGMSASRKIGGVTGDVLGAGSELTEIFVWITGALYALF